jgi:hypothetical protein
MAPPNGASLPTLGGQLYSDEGGQFYSGANMLLGVWENRETHLATAARIDGTILGIERSFNFRGRCFIEVTYEHGTVDLHTGEPCRRARLEQLVGSTFRITYFRTGGVSELVIGDEHIAKFYEHRREYNAIILFIGWLPLFMFFLSTYGRRRREKNPLVARFSSSSHGPINTSS